MATKYVTASDARRALLSLIDSVERTVITKNGRPVAVLVPFEDFRALHASTILAREPAMLAQIMATHVKVRRGELTGLRELTDEFLETGVGQTSEVQPPKGSEPPVAKTGSSLEELKRKLLETDEEFRQLARRAGSPSHAANKTRAHFEALLDDLRKISSRQEDPEPVAAKKK